MTVIWGRACLICDEWMGDGHHLVRLPRECLCPYPHWTLPTPLPGWQSSISAFTLATSHPPDR